MIQGRGEGAGRCLTGPDSPYSTDPARYILVGSTEEVRRSSSRRQEGVRPLSSNANPTTENNEANWGGMLLSSLFQERLMRFEGELRPQLRFVNAPALMVPFQFFSLILEVTDALGGTVTSLRLLEALRLRQKQELQCSLLRKPPLDFLLPPVDVELSMELHDYGLFQTGCRRREDDGTEFRKNLAVVATHPSPFASMRCGTGCSLSSVLNGRTEGPPFTTVSGILGDPHMDGLAISRLCNENEGMRENESSEWSSFAHSEPCIAIGPPEASHCGLQFRLCSRTQTIVGLFNSRLLDTLRRASHAANTGEKNSGSPDHDGVFSVAEKDDICTYVASERTWCFLSYSIHLSAARDDLGPVAFRIYELGKMVETVGTQVANIDDVFAIRFLECGRCIYLQNDRVCHISSQMVEPHSLYSLLVRVAHQERAPALDRLVLLPFVSGRPKVEIMSLMCKPQWPHLSCVDGSPATSHVVDEEPATTKVILRGWLRGFPADAALHTSDVACVSFPSWAVAAMSLVSSFVLGAAGFSSSCCNGTLAALQEHHRLAPLLQLHPQRLRRPLTYSVGVK